MFPSPFGVMEFEQVVVTVSTVQGWFPSPFGVMEFEPFNNKEVEITFEEYRFPSPFGVMEFELCRGQEIVLTEASSFRPLSG